MVPKSNVFTYKLEVSRAGYMCYGLNVCVPLKFYVEILKPNVIVILGDGVSLGSD